MELDRTRPVVASAVRPNAAHPPIEWSRWSHCDTSFSLLLVPSAPGVYAVAEQVTATSDTAEFGCQRMLAVFKVGQADDLARALSRLFAADSTIRERLLHSRCYLRYAVIKDQAERTQIAGALDKWLHGDAADAANRLAAAAAATAAAPIAETTSETPARGVTAAGPAPGEEPHLGFASSGKPPFPSGF